MIEFQLVRGLIHTAETIVKMATGQDVVFVMATKKLNRKYKRRFWQLRKWLNVTKK